MQDERAYREWERHMLRGDFEEAWRVGDRLRGAPMPLPEDGRVLIRCCRGLGDAIQFLRYAPMLKRLGNEVLVQCPARLIPLLELMDGIDHAISNEEKTPDHDSEIECNELIYAFRTSLESIPANIPYIRVKGLRENEARAARVGLAWAAGAWNPTRNLPLECLETLSRVKGVEFFSLQRESGPAAFLFPCLETATSDIVHTAVSILGLDLVVSVDTMVAHLAGALGQPVWTLLRHQADWRWMRDRADSPWYPTMRLFRQPRPGDWEGLIARVVDGLRLWRDRSNRAPARYIDPLERAPFQEI